MNSKLGSRAVDVLRWIALVPCALGAMWAAAVLAEFIVQIQSGATMGHGNGSMFLVGLKYAVACVASGGALVLCAAWIAPRKKGVVAICFASVLLVLSCVAVALAVMDGKWLDVGGYVLTNIGSVWVAAFSGWIPVESKIDSSSQR